MRQFFIRVLESLSKLKRSEMTGLRVVATKRLTPHMLRVSFSGKELDRFADPDNLHVRLILPPSQVSRDDWLVIGRDGKAAMRDASLTPLHRKYTIRTIDPAAGRIDIDFVLHGDAGPGSAWAEGAKPGNVIGIVGPGGRSCGKADWHLFAGDETALPAIGRILETLPADAQGIVVIEIADAGEEQALRLPERMSLTWLHRDGVREEQRSLLYDAVANVAWPAGGVRIFAWVAGEFQAVNAIRRYLRSDRKLGKEQHLAVAYWRRSEAEERNNDA